MLPTSLALAWPLWQRHRWGFLLALGYLAIVVIVASVLPMATLGPRMVNAILVPMMIPLIGLPTYLVVVFSFGYEADVNVRESCFPRGLFRLPVSTGALAGWHLAYGAGAAFSVWLVIAWFILRPWLSLWDVAVPLWWPAVLGLAMQAWFQAVLWSPVGLPGIRIVLVAALIPVQIAVAQHYVEAGASETFLVSLFGGVAAAGWLVSYVGISMGRRGDVPNWDVALRPFGQLALWLPHRRLPLADAARAQVWFEWRRTGLGLPVMTGVVLPFVLLPLLFGKNDAIPTARTLLGALAIPVLLAGLAGTAVSGNHAWVKDYYGVSPFTASLPMSTAAMVSAKLKAAALSTLAAWALFALTVFLALVLTGTIHESADWWQDGLRNHHPAKIVMGIGAVTIMLPLWTWKRMVDSLFLGLTGRKWVIQGSLFAGMFAVAALVAVVAWVKNHPEVHDTALALLPWLLGLGVFCRLTATAWAITQLRRQNLVSTGMMLSWSIAWLLVALALVGMLAWAVPRELVPVRYLAFAVVFVLPLGRLAATPLALAWNRHR